MTTLLIILHVAVCLFLIVIVLLQHGKGADMGATFGGSSQTVFGTEGPLPLLNKITTASAIIFMVTSLLLAQLSGQKTIMQDVAAPPPPVETTQAETTKQAEMPQQQAETQASVPATDTTKASEAPPVEKTE